MNKPTPLEKKERKRLIDELSNKYSKKSPMSLKWVYYRKKYSWLIVVTATKLFKRLIDIGVSSVMLVLLFPLMLLVALLIKAYDGGPVFYFSTRIGKWGRKFSFPKFRTMKTGADQIKATLAKENESTDGTTFKMRKDPRITPIGAILRRSSIDELPQLWCVLKGDMSLVGPRPPLPEEVASYTPKERSRLEIRPGLTCIWQVSGRSNLPFQQQVQLDRQYIESQSLLLDLKILLRTIPAVFLGRGAY